MLNLDYELITKDFQTSFHLIFPEENNNYVKMLRHFFLRFNPIRSGLF